MPAIFFGHGSPMNAVQDNAYSRAWTAMGRDLPRPAAILAISAHWETEGTSVTASEKPRTIHDFGSFPPELFRVQYPAPGSPQLARRVRDVLADVTPVALDERWGLDHATWTVLRHLYPDADVPVVQLSLDATKPPQFHYELGRALARLRDESVTIVGTGNVVHNLSLWRAHAPQPAQWAERFETKVRDLIAANDVAPLIDYPSMGPDALLAIPGPDHYLPLLYVLGTRDPADAVSFPIAGVDAGALSMLTVCLTPLEPRAAF